ncbi:MAG: right-handed parallel beta-helix repeat-containing protein [Verrucomicrobiaceae bacterium]|nr:right-handed parallel beta-helix repeat-containing protein [Verrucomicrobiaceae bacterium]
MTLRLFLPAFFTALACSADAQISAAAYPSIQAALAANPNKMVFVPAGDHVITEKIRIRGERSGLYGPGRIIQQNAEQPIIEIENANGIEIRDVTLTRPDDKTETQSEALRAQNCRDLVIENVKVINNRTKSGAILVTDSRTTRISRCLVRNYMKVSIDDRTQGDVSGYAFRCTDGTGIMVRYCQGTLIEGNQVIEETYFPSKESREKFKLGAFVKKNPQKGPHLSQQAWDAGYTDNWRQGSAIQVTAPESSDFTRLLGNHIENAAQGIDLHCDHVIVSNNIVNHAHIGMKAMHGSRNVLITGNQFTRNDLWAIGLMPGAAAHPAQDGKPANADGGSIIANNIISDFGHGDAHWMWGEERSPFKFDAGQDADDPPLTEVLIQGNLVHNLGPPRYIYDVLISTEPRGPLGLHFSNNVFPPGTRGVCNQELKP